MNIVLVSGKMGRDPIFRMTPNGTATCRFSVGCRAEHKNKEGKYNIDYVDFLAWGTVAENIANNCPKGTEVFVKAHGTSGSYDGKDGKKVYTKDLVVDDVKILQSVNGIATPFSGMGTVTDDAGQEIPF